MKVEVDLHEWIPDLLFQNKAGEAKAYGKEFALNEGKYPDGETSRWESIDMMEKRLLGVLDKYVSYDKILIVTHGMLMHQIKPYGHIPNCFVDSFTYDEHFKCAGFEVGQTFTRMVGEIQPSGELGSTEELLYSNAGKV